MGFVNHELEQKQAADKLRWSRIAVYRKLAKYNILRARKGEDVSLTDHHDNEAGRYLPHRSQRFAF